MRRMISTLNIMNFFSESSYVTVSDDSISVEVILVMQVQATKIIQGSCGQEKSGFGGPVVRKNSNFEKVRKKSGKRVSESGKVRIFVFFAT